MIRKNAAAGVYLYAHDKSADTPKTGDAANITGYVSKDGAAEAAFGTANPSEIDATNMPGVYWQPLTQGETNGDALALGWKSSTSDIVIEPLLILTEPAPGSTGGAAGFEQLPAALVSGRVDASVGAMAAGVVTAAAVATGAIDADAVAADAVTEIQSGLATAADLATVAGYVDTEVAAIKAKTDQLTFTNAGKVDAAVLAAGDFAQAAADKVWTSAARTLTSFGTLVADIWAAATRTLTSGGGLSAAQTAAAVWDALRASYVVSGSMGESQGRLDVTVSSRAASGVVVQATSPIGQAGVLSMKVSDDYKIADGTAITFSYTGSAVLTGGTVAMKTYDSGNTAIGATLTGTISGSAGAYTISIEATAVQTALLSSYAGGINLRYDVEATVSGRKTTILSGLLKVLQD